MTNLKVGEIVILKPKNNELPIKSYVKEIIMPPTPNGLGTYHSGLYSIHGFGEMFGDEIERTNESISEQQLRHMRENNEEEALLA